MQTPNFTGAPRCGLAQLGTANANRDGSGTLVPLLIGGASGTKITSVNITPLGTTTQGMVRLFLKQGASAAQFLMDIPIDPNTPSATVPSATQTVTFTDLDLPDSTWTLEGSTQNGELFSVVVNGGDF
jgi:hypothetical protein